MSEHVRQEEAVGSIVKAWAAAAEQSRDIVNSSFATLASESRAFVDDMARDSVEALRDLQTCKSPLEVIGVEQKWMLARSKSYFDAGLRFMTGALREAERAAAESADVRLPD